MKKYVFREYDPQYPTFFSLEAKKLEEILGMEVRVEHVGSTAVPGLGGKGIIDVVIGVPKEKMWDTKKILEKHYVFREQWSTPERLYFIQDYPYQGSTRRVHIHLTEEEGEIWRELVGFRDYLLAHPAALKKYVMIKKEAVKVALGEGEKYRKHKDAFIKDILDKL